MYIRMYSPIRNLTLSPALSYYESLRIEQDSKNRERILIISIFTNLNNYSWKDINYFYLYKFK